MVNVIVTVLRLSGNSLSLVAGQKQVYAQAQDEEKILILVLELVLMPASRPRFSR